MQKVILPLPFEHLPYLATSWMTSRECSFFSPGKEKGNEDAIREPSGGKMKV